MNPSFRRLLALILCMDLAACTSLQAVPDWQPAPAPTPSTQAAELKPGDKITITTTDNQKAELIFVQLTTDHIEGTVGKDKKPVQIPRAQVKSIERREFSALKTVGLVALIVATLLLSVSVEEAGFLGGNL